MTYTEKYIISFGQVTSKELEIIKGTYKYQICLLADEWEKLRKEILDSLKGLLKR